MAEGDTILRTATQIDQATGAVNGWKSPPEPV